MDDLFRFSTAVRRHPAVEAWLEESPPALGAIARTWLDRLRSCGDNVHELMHDGHGTVCVGTAAFAYVGIFKAHVNVGFFFGADLEDPSGLLEGTGRSMRHVKLRPGAEVDDAALTALIETAYADMTYRVGAGA